MGSLMGPGNGDSVHKAPCDPNLGHALYGEPRFIPIIPSAFIHLTELWDRGSVQEVTPLCKGCHCRTTTTRTPNIPSLQPQSLPSPLASGVWNSYNLNIY